jgi:hypothetical protein
MPNPNTNFTAGQILTADQQNRLPRGIMAFTKATTSINPISGQIVAITAPTFTAVANRLYRMTYQEANITTGGGPTSVDMRIRLTNTSGTVFAFNSVVAVNLKPSGGCCVGVTTLSAGPTVIVGTLDSPSGNTFRNATDYFSYLIIEDIGPA